MPGLACPLPKKGPDATEIGPALTTALPCNPGAPRLCAIVRLMSYKARCSGHGDDPLALSPIDGATIEKP